MDTDIGTDVDDALALTLAVRSPEVDILAVTTVGSDVRLRGRIARKLLRVLGRDEIPVAAGCDRRLNGQEFRPMPISGARGFIENEQDGLPLQEQHAVDLIIDLLQAANTKITLVLIGPVTNAAMALKRWPQIKEKIERFVFVLWAILVNALPVPRSKNPPQSIRLPRSYVWLAFGLVFALFYFVVLGPGLGPLEEDPRLR